MKYEIKGMPNERVIKTYTISDDKKSIMVKYLDGTTDYFPYSQEIESRIVNIMLEQAGRYLKKEENVTFSETGHLVKSVVSGVGSLAFLGCSGLVLTNDPNYYLVGAAVALASITTVELIKKGANKRELTYLRKVKTYLDNKEAIDSSYKAIADAERELGNTELPSSITINNIDSINASTVSLAATKCLRYPKIYRKEK